MREVSVQFMSFLMPEQRTLPGSSKLLSAVPAQCVFELMKRNSPHGGTRITRSECALF